MSVEFHPQLPKSEDEETPSSVQSSPIPETQMTSSKGSKSRREEGTGKAFRRRRTHRTRHKVDLSQIQPGQQYQGRVVGLANFGAFVDIGVARDGLLHVSEIKEGFVDKVENVLAVGDEVKVWIKSVDQERNRISLTMIEPHNPSRALTDLEPGMVVEGTVEGVTSFGVFVNIGAPVNGLVHISEMAEGYVRKPQSIVSLGDDVKVRVLEVDPANRRISLSMKDVEPSNDPTREIKEPPLFTAMQFAWQRALEAKKATRHRD